MNLRYLIYGVQILLGLALAITGFMQNDPLMTVAWLVVAVSGAVLFWHDPGGPLEV
ncbi:NAD(P)(+) transhydrogenase (Re/Si-specific) subunit beta [Salinigranum rubrum]|uniref:NAD(P)(+) transhydrogenase (Re/Si-specific) subunit beta n=1 Tax=Salinigranum rubrum TaxID=755307 RepID=UPI0013A57EED|nr:NAD(P)(+) transhydrogenase (Re/Si-specific) subunit beta [Salinigranum rubrum]